MIALNGEYDNGTLKLENIPPVSKAKVIVLFPDISKCRENDMTNDKAKSVFNKYTGCVSRAINEKEERIESMDEKYMERR